jgi:hypothetical protein
VVRLRQIKELAGKTHVESKIQILARAYALTVGANLGKLPAVTPTALASPIRRLWRARLSRFWRGKRYCHP